jgi:hypothetical protein
MHNNINDYSFRYSIYLRAYSAAQIPIMKEALAKEIKNKQTENIKTIYII